MAAAACILAILFSFIIARGIGWVIAVPLFIIASLSLACLCHVI